MSSHRVAVVQAGPVPFNAPQTLAKALSLLSEAAARGAEVVVFPEAFLTAYPKGLDFGARVGMRSPRDGLSSAAILRALLMCQALRAKRSRRQPGGTACIS